MSSENHLLKQDESEKTSTKIGFTVIILGIVFWGALSLTGMVGLTDLTYETATKLLTGIGVVTIIIERSIEIILKVWRGEGRAEKDQDINLANANLEKAIKGEGELSIDLCETNKRIADYNLINYRQQTAVLAIRLSYFIGVVISLAGFRVLENLYDAGELGGLQHNMFHSIDIILTAGLIAGGSKGLHLLTQTFGDFFEAQRKISKKKGNESGS